jgi:hypothetical protein
LRRHYETLHKDKFGVLEGRLRENKWKNLKFDLQWQQNILTVATKKWSSSSSKLYYITNNR